MTSLQHLRDQKSVLEAEMARVIKATNEKKLALEAQIEKHRIEEILQGRFEIQQVLKKYNLSKEEAFGTATPMVIQGGVSAKGASYLSEIRQYYNS